MGSGGADLGDEVEEVLGEDLDGGAGRPGEVGEAFEFGVREWQGGTSWRGLVEDSGVGSREGSVLGEEVFEFTVVVEGGLGVFFDEGDEVEDDEEGDGVVWGVWEGEEAGDELGVDLLEVRGEFHGGLSGC